MEHSPDTRYKWGFDDGIYEAETNKKVFIYQFKNINHKNIMEHHPDKIYSKGYVDGYNRFNKIKIK